MEKLFIIMAKLTKKVLDSRIYIFQKLLLTLFKSAIIMENMLF
ncbi:hypothetical protein D920_01424 [Enterococcus faecalis 13-SD-W-01]|nr:hypothetical protein D920_01424 [Enterococcus faecalis 13-SD-W-01]